MQIKPATGLLPAALRPATALDPAETRAPHVYEHETAAPAIQAFEKLLGGRAGLAADLLLSPDLTPTIRRVLELIYDPRFDREPLGRLCAKAGLTPGEFFAAFRDAAIAKAHVQALQKLADALPQLTVDLLTQAVHHEETCHRCEGETTITVTMKAKRRGQPPIDTIKTCPTCRGTGLVRVKADLETQKIALELIGLLKKSGGITLTQQQLTMSAKPSLDASESPLGGLAQLQQAVSGILFSRDLPRPDDDRRTADPPPAGGDADLIEATLVEAPDGSRG